jgi:hypothetical protein
MANRFEIDRFMPRNRNVANNPPGLRSLMEQVDFLPKVVLDKSKINYAFLNSFNLKGAFGAERLSYKNIVLNPNMEFKVC